MDIQLGVQKRNSNEGIQSSWIITHRTLWTWVVLPIHVSYRVYIANRMPIMDCDETFNYWEVVHFLLFRDENAFQTWEYANEFGLRTYAYLMPIVGIARLYMKIIGNGFIPRSIWSVLTDQEFDPMKSPKVGLFVLLRSTLGAFMAYSEVAFCYSIIEQGNYVPDVRATIRSITDSGPKGSNVVWWFTCVGWVSEFLLISSAGMAHASGALLPSSTLMGLWMLAAAAYLREHHVQFCFLAIIATLAIGWPFGVIVLIPLGVGVLFRERKEIAKFVCFRIVPIAGIIQGLVMLVDYQHYGRFFSPLLNILQYNAQSGGDELYGVEPFSFYVKNLVLNLNYVAPAGLGGIFLLGWSKFRSNTPFVIWEKLFTLMIPLYLWLAIVAPRAHKEERFLYPVYPCFCLGAAIGSVSFAQWFQDESRDINVEPKQQVECFKGNRRNAAIILALIWIPASAVSFGRTLALSRYYSAPLHVYAQMKDVIDQHVQYLELKSASESPLVCSCGEWYRFPSSFFVHSKLRFGFAPSTFTGQLPQHFQREGSGTHDSDGPVNRFNDRNEPESGSYVPLESCDFLVELSSSLHSCIHQSFLQTQWISILEVPFFDVEKTSSALHRILYIPYVHEHAVEAGKVHYDKFVLFSRW